MRALVGVGLLGALGWGLIGVAPAAAATPKPKPVVVSFVAAPLQLPAEGGSVRVTVRVRNATTCTFRHQPTAAAALRKDAVMGCTGGKASALVQVGANASQQAATLRFDVQVAGRTGKAVKAVSVVQAPPPPPLAVAATTLPGGTVKTPYSATLTASGGTAPYTWTLTAGSLPIGLTLATSGAVSGTPTSSGTFPVTVQVADAKGQTATGKLSIAVAAPVLAVGSPEVSSNWSGYALDGGSFTFATGTFTVPTVSSSGSRTSTAEWVGVDGDSDTNSDLIQAGVAEEALADGTVDVFAWWEILPAAETPINTIDVKMGDTVTVTLEQLSPGSWSIQVVDDTSGQSFSTTQSYGGRGLSAEWIVEAATDARSNSVFTLGPYSPPVTFTGIGWAAGLTGGWTPIQLDQGNGVVSDPSGFNGAQSAFAVANSSSPPPAPS